MVIFIWEIEASHPGYYSLGFPGSRPRDGDWRANFLGHTSEIYSFEKEGKEIGLGTGRS